MTIKAGDVIVEYSFIDGTKMTLVWDEREKWVVDHKEKYLSPRVKYFSKEGEDYQYSYANFYKKALATAYNLYKTGKCTGIVARDEVFRKIFGAHQIERIDIEDLESIKSGIEKMRRLVKLWDCMGFGFEEEIEKVIIGAGLGFAAEDKYLKYNARVRFGRDFNLIKYYLVLIGDEEIVGQIEELIGRTISIEGRLSPEVASQLFNKDGIAIDVKEKFILALMTKIRKKFDPTYRDIESSWG